MTPKIIFTISTLILSIWNAPAIEPDTLWESFISPQKEARTKVWWFHGETETTKEGIDADLQAFKDAGIGGVVYYDQTHGSQEGAFASLSKEWWEMLKYAALKAKKLGLTFDVASTNGYVAGGPWIIPDMGMKKIVVVMPGEEIPARFKELMTISAKTIPDKHNYIDTVIQKERINLTDNEPLQITVDFHIPKAIRTISYQAKPRGKGAYGSMNIPGKPSKEYFGAKYISLPPIGEFQCSDDGINWEMVTPLRGIEDIIGHKSNQRTINFKAVKARYFRLNIHDWQGADSIHRSLYIENVRLMSYDKTDNWESKSGLRSELPSDTLVDKEDGFVSFYGEAKIGYVPTGGRAKHRRNRIIWNGKELTAKTWPEADVLDKRAAELHYNSYFKAIHDTLAGIGCKPAGMQIDSHEAGIANWTEKMPEHFKRINGYSIDHWLPALGGFIVDSRQSTEKFLRDFKGTISQLVREEFYSTLDSLCRRDGVVLTSQAMLGCANDNIASRGMIAKPQGEFWGYQKNGNYDCLDAASAAHLYGKRIASGEAFTDSQYFYPENATDTLWKERGWHELLRLANLAFCRGINELVVCASTYQPWLNRKYDDSQSAHPYIFHRLNAAWDKSREHFWEYQARCAQLLQTGRPAVDILVYTGEDLPGKTMAFKLPEVPEGYQFDNATYAALKHWMKNKTGLTPEYKILAVQGRSQISEKSERLIKELAKQGMIIVRCDKGESIHDAIIRYEIKPDIKIKSENEPDNKVYFCHRVHDGIDVYFIYNHSKTPYTSEIELRNKKSIIELWNPLSGERKVPKHNTLSIEPYQALFLIARNGNL